MVNSHSRSYKQTHKALGPDHIKDQNNMQTMKVMKISLVLIGAFMLLEFLGGLFANSMALISDSLHMFSDFLSVVFGLVAMYVAKGTNNSKKTYGYSRFEVIASLINTLALVFICVYIIAESIKRVIEKPPVNAEVMIPIAMAGLFCNLVVVYLSWKDVHKTNKDSQNTNQKSLLMKGVFLHFLSDTLGSIIAIIAGIIIYYTNWHYIDPILSLMLVALLLRSCWYIMRDSINILMEGAPNNIDSLQIKAELEKQVQGVKNVHHIHLWRLNEVENIITMHVEINTDFDGIEIVKEVKSYLSTVYNINHATVQIETTKSGCL